MYQADYTIIRWISLSEHEILELECGEDVDHILQQINGGELRTLEQLKHRESSISLNQRLTLDLFLNFYQHRINNPGIDLQFRFVSNSGYVLERPSLFIGDSRKGIEVWETLRKSSDLESMNVDFKLVQGHLVKKISEIIAKLEALMELQLEQIALWKGFLAYVQKDDHLIAFIQDFEWAAVQDNSQVIQTSVIEALASRFPLMDAKQLYDRLFFYLFRLLCQPGIKRITKADIERESALNPLGDQDQKILTLLQGIVGKMDPRVEQLEEAMCKASDQLDVLYASVEVLKSDTKFSLILDNLNNQLPDPIAAGTLRADKTAELTILFSRYSWIEFCGINGCGKTQLAGLLARQVSRSYWLDLREMGENPLHAALVIQNFLCQISGLSMRRDQQAWLDGVFSRLMPNSLIILNDLPEFYGDGGALGKLLLIMLRKANHYSIKILTTANHPIERLFINAGMDAQVLLYQDFEFSDQEIIECLVNHGAGEGLTQYAKLIAASSSRNPRLVLAMIYFLRDRSWGEDKGDRLALAFSSDFSAEVIADNQRSIQQQISDANIKELLYRLSLISYDFGMHEVSAISQVEIPVQHPAEKLGSLVHVWIQALDHQRFQVSPIVKNIGELNLSKKVVGKVHCAYANALLSGGTINQKTATRAILSFLKGGQVNDAGVVLVNFYRHVKTVEEVKMIDQWGYLSMWTDLPIQEDMDLMLQIFIKLEQLRLFQLIGRDTRILIDVLDSYLLRNDLSVNAGIVIRLGMLIREIRLPLAKFWDYLDFLLEHWEAFTALEVGSEVDLSQFSSFIWIPVMQAVNDFDIDRWMGAVNRFKSEFDQNVLEHEIFYMGVALIISQIPSEKYDGEGIRETKFDQICRLGEFFERQGAPDLEAIVFREKIDLMVRGGMDVLKGVEMIEARLSETSSPINIFFYKAFLGRLLYRRELVLESLPWLQEAIALDFAEELEFTSLLEYTAGAVQQRDIAQAVNYCQRAVDISVRRSPYLPSDHWQALGELMVAHFLNDDVKACFLIWEILVSLLYENKAEYFGDDWIRIFSLIGHAGGYIASTQVRNEVPELNGEEFFRPYVGMFVLRGKELTARYQVKNDPIICAQIALLAEHLDELEKAFKWSLSAFDRARASGNDGILLTVSSTCSQFATAAYHPTEAFESYLLFAAVSAHTPGESKDKFTDVQGLDISSLLKQKPSEAWNIAEATVVQGVVTPLMLQVLLSIESGADNSQDRTDRLLSTLLSYLPEASDQLDFENVVDIVRGTIEGHSHIDHFYQRANVFGDQNKKHLQIFCLVALSHLEKNNSKLLSVLLNVTPFLQRAYRSMTAVAKHILIPYVKFKVAGIIREEFVGSIGKMNQMLEVIESIPHTDENALQYILQPAQEILQVKMEANRSAWLNEYKAI